MPAILASFNRFLLLLLVQFLLVPAALSQFPQFSQPQLQWLGDRIFQNECNKQYQCLTSWNAGEDFPSLGIGHFIWYREGQTEVFEETFPTLLETLRNAQYALPQWIEQLDTADSPWQNREQFLADVNSPRMRELRQFLANTMELQLAFIVQRLYASVPELLLSVSDEQREPVAASFYQIANSHPPYGLYAVIDYVHFKGTGMAVRERYQGEGWGLLQVLLEMQLKQQGEAATLENFVDSAARVLERRVANSPGDRQEQRWIAGWKNRLLSYLPIDSPIGSPID
jgi:hypothetical protein